jgi:hypothetical protein
MGLLNSLITEQFNAVTGKSEPIKYIINIINKAIKK